MAADIVPDLYQKIDARFEKEMKSNTKIQNFLAKLEKETASAKEVSLYAAQVGKCAADALGAYLISENLPDGKLYWNIADRTIRPLLQKSYQLVLDAAKTQQQIMDRNVGIKLQPMESRFPKERIRDLIDKLIAYQNEEADGKQIREPIGFRYP